MLFLETEHPTPLAAAAAADTLLGLRCLAWLAYSAKLALLGSRQPNGQAADALAWAARSRPRAKMGGGEQRLLLKACIGVRRLMRWLALHACGPLKRWGGVSGARFTRLGLLSLIISACVGVKPVTCQLALHAPSPG
jgi:hypothetical protein